MGRGAWKGGDRKCRQTGWVFVVSIFCCWRRVGDIRVHLDISCHLLAASHDLVLPLLRPVGLSVVNEPELRSRPSSPPGPGDLCHHCSSTGCMPSRSQLLTPVWICPENLKFYYLLPPRCLLNLFVSPNCHCCHLKSSYLHLCPDHAVATSRSMPPFSSCTQFSTQQEEW